MPQTGPPTVPPAPSSIVDLAPGAVPLAFAVGWRLAELYDRVQPSRVGGWRGSRGPVSSRPPSNRACGSPAHGSPTCFTGGHARRRRIGRFR
jgi:hypothetical protein